jgi:hypothetical protein
LGTFATASLPYLHDDVDVRGAADREHLREVAHLRGLEVVVGGEVEQQRPLRAVGRRGGPRVERGDGREQQRERSRGERDRRSRRPRRGWTFHLSAPLAGAFQWPGRTIAVPCAAT